MSKQIENEVVKMSFDNRDFEKNISTSTKSVEKLNEDLKFKDADKGFRDLEKYANSVNFDGLTKAIANINSVFTVTGNLSKKIIDDIAGYFESKIVGTVRSVTNTVGYIMDTNLGVQKYEQYTTAMNTLRANMTSVDQMQFEAQKSKGAFENELEYIEMYMDRILTFTDETSYSFTDMVDTIAKFTSSDVDLERASQAIMGMANVAAVAGQNANVATMSMQQLAQSFGTGYVKYEDWKQAFTSKNMVTKELKQTLVDAALGVTLDEKDIEEAKRRFGEKNYADFFFTSEMLGKKWLDTDQVLVKGLSEYSKASTEILNTMEKIGGDASVTDMLGWVEDFKEANKNGTVAAKEFAESIARDYDIEDAESIEEISKMIEKLSGAEYELSLKAFLAAQQATNFHEAIDATRDAVGTKMMKMMTYFIGDLDQARKLWTGFSNSLWEIFAGPLDATLDGLEEFNKGIAETVEIEGELVEITWYDKFWDGVARAFTGIGGIINDFLDIIRIFAGAFEETEDELGETTIETESILEKYTFGFMKKVTNAVTTIADAIERFRESTVMELLLDVFKNLVMIFVQIRKIIHIISSAVIGTALRNIHKPIEVILSAVVKLLTTVNKFLSSVIKGNTFSKLISALKTITKLCVDLFTNVLKKAGDVLSKIVGFLKDIWEWLWEKLSPVFHSILDFVEEHSKTVMNTMADGIDLVSDAFDWLVKKFKDAKDWFGNFIHEITGTDFKTINQNLKELGTGFIEGMSGVGSRTLEVTKKYASSVFDPNNKASIPYLANELKGADSAVVGAQKAITWLGDALANPIHFVFDMVGAILNTDLSKAADLICSFIERVTGALAKVTPGVMEIVGKIIDVLAWVVIHAIDLIKTIVGFASGTLTTTGSTILDRVLDAVVIILQVLLTMIAVMFEMVGKIAQFLSPYIMDLLNEFGDFMRRLLDKIKEIAHDLLQSDPKELFHSAVGLLFLLLGIVAIIKVIMLFYNFLAFINGFGGPIGKISTGILWVCDSMSGVLDTLSGYGVPGMILYLTAMILAIGYAMSSMAKIAEGIADPEKQQYYFLAIGMCFLFFIGIMAAMRVLLKSVMKQSKLLDSDTSMFNFGGAMLGVAAIIIAVAFALTRLVEGVGPNNIEAVEVAGLTIITILLSLALFLKLVAGEGEYSKEFEALKKKGITQKVSKSGTTYAGIASAVKGLATALALIMLSMAAVLKVLNGMKDPSLIWDVFWIIEGLLVTLGAFVILLERLFTSSEAKSIVKLKGNKTKTSNGNSSGASFMQSAGLVALIYGIMTFTVVVMGAIVIAAVAIEKAGVDVDLLLIISGIIIGIMLALGVAMRLIMSVADESDKWAIKAFLKKIAKLLMVSMVFTTFAILLAVIAGSIASLAGVVAAEDALQGDGEDGDVGNTKKEDKRSPFATALSAIMKILVTIFVFTMAALLLTKAMDWESIMGVALVFFTLAILVKMISVAIVAMVAEFAAVDALGADKAVTQAVASLAIILGLVLALVATIGVIGMLFGGGGATGAAMIMAIGVAILAISVAIWSLTKALLALTVACAGGGFDDMIEALKVLGIVMAGLIVFVALLGLIGYVFGPAFLAIAAGMGILAAAILVLDLAILLLIPAVELATNYLVDKQDAVMAAFMSIGIAIGSAIAGIVAGFVQGVAAAAPIILQALIDLVTTIMKGLTEWLSDPEVPRMIAEFFFAFWTAVIKASVYFTALMLDWIGDIISKLWKWLGDHVFKPGQEFIRSIPKRIGNLIMKGIDLILKPFKAIIKKVRKIFKIESPSGVFEDIGDNIMKGLINGVKKAWDGVVGLFQSLCDVISSIFENGLINTVEVGIEKALNGGKTVEEAHAEERNQKAEEKGMDKVSLDKQKAENYVSKIQKYFTLLNNIEKGAYRTEADKAEAEAKIKELETEKGIYSISHIKELETSQKNALYNKLKELGYWTSAGFVQGLYSSGDPRSTAAKYMGEFVGGCEKRLGIASPSKVFKGIGDNIVQGLKNGIDLDSIKEFGSDMMGSLTSGFTDDMGGLTDITSEMSNMIPDTSSMMPNMDNYTSQLNASSMMPDTSSLYGNTGLTDINTMSSYTPSIDYSGVNKVSGLDNLNAYTTSENASYATSAVDSSNADIVEQLKKLNDNLIAWREASSKTEIYMDTGALVGEIVDPLDKEMGKRANLKANRGV